MKDSEMDYERIHKKSQQATGGALSPRKLKSMILGGEKKKNLENEEDIESTFSLRSIEDSGDFGSENCKDVDVVSVLHDGSSSSTAASLSPDLSLFSIPKIKTQSDGYSGDGGDLSSNTFEFQRSEKAAQRVPAHTATFSKGAPSKWDNAQKWVPNPVSNKTKTSLPIGSRNNVGNGSRLTEGPDQNSGQFEEPDTKCIDSSQNHTDSFGQKNLAWESEPYPDNGRQSAINLSHHDSLVSIQTPAPYVPPGSTARSVSMRDMGTEMTPMASQEPSRTATPLRATTPFLRSPASSRPTTPRRLAIQPSSVTVVTPEDQAKEELSQREMQRRTRKDIIRLGNQLGKLNIAAWASKEEANSEASSSLQTPAPENTAQNTAQSVIETRATAWEEAEKAKYLARFRREEVKIQAWENHQKAKAEAVMRKLQAQVENVRVKSHEKLTKKIAAASQKAEAKRAAADAERNQQASKTEQQADYIRRTGRTPSSIAFCCGGWVS